MPTSRVELRQLLGNDPEAFIRQSLLDQLAVLHVFEDKDLLGEEPEPLHQYRVAIRNLRSRLKFYKPYFKDEALIDSWSREFKWLDSQLQPLRDLEVQGQLFSSIVSDELQNLISKPSKYQALRKAALAVEAGLAEPLATARERLEYAVLSNRKADLLKVAKTGLLLAELKPKKIGRLETQLLKKLESRTDAIETTLRKTSLPKLGSKRLHSLRIECKQARYLAASIGLPTKHLERCQSELGDINDLEIMCRWLSALQTRSRANRKAMAAILNIAKDQLAKKRGLLASLQPRNQ